VAAKQKIPTPLDYVHFLAGLPAPVMEPEEEGMGIPIPTPVWMPNPQTLDMSQIPGLQGGGGGNPYDQGGPTLPPPIAPPAPPGFSGSGGSFSPNGGAFG
jgi:hypothetical protein